MPSFTAIIPNYNDGAHISASLASLFAQTRPFDEILILDDGSTDDSTQVIERLIAGHPQARLIRRQENKGIVTTLNEGLHAASGDFVFMASANDTYNHRLVEYAAAALEMKPDLAIICGNGMFQYTETGKRQPVKMQFPQVAGYISRERFEEQVRCSPITFFGGSVILKRDAVLQEGGLAPALRWHCDWAMYYLLSYRHGLYYVPEPMVNVEVSGASYSSQAMIWGKQRPVIEALIHFLARQDTAMRQAWKHTAMLPTYPLKVLRILIQPEYRWYMTPLLVWRIVIHTMAYRLKYYLPRSFLLKMREKFRV